MGECGGIVMVVFLVVEVMEVNLCLWLLLCVGEYVLLEICDNGCGMDVVMVEWIFELFFMMKSLG